ncbi:DUF6691 family protein [Acaryochloris marina]|uniref:YeeE/YedE family membrane protein, putative n=1 Tax=Acaryochloris marina (strain MBIC 11017) TaxID=329726 RepID=A8ZP07_ACAM1|nr:YeeE/YedE family membrane protein, putative [Acaryochloris marina MBIC11017]
MFWLPNPHPRVYKVNLASERIARSSSTSSSKTLDVIGHNRELERAAKDNRTPRLYVWGGISKQAIDLQLLIGSAIFGIGWGMAGYCPGPGLVALVLGIWNPFLFIISLMFGSLFYHWITTQRINRSPKVPNPNP